MEVAFKLNLILLVIVGVILTCGVLFVVRGMASRKQGHRRRSSLTDPLVAVGIVFAVALVALPTLYLVRSAQHRSEEELHRARAVREAQETHRAAERRGMRATEPTLEVSRPSSTRKTTVEEGTTEITSLPVLSIEQVLRPRHDFEAWNEGNTLAPSEPEKPWVLDAAGSQARSVEVLGWTIHGRWPGPSGQVAGYSAFDEPDRESAIHTARHSAQHHLKAMLLGEVSDFLKGPQARRVLRKALDGFEPKITEYLLKHEADQLVQRREGSVGFSSYRAAVLVDAGQETFKPFAGEFKDRILQTMEQNSATRHQFILAVASALGLALVVFLLYSFLNAGTKGHFAWPLRIISIGTLVVLYLGLMFLQGWFPL